jgi:hypothetical protein
MTPELRSRLAPAHVRDGLRTVSARLTAPLQLTIEPSAEDETITAVVEDARGCRVRVTAAVHDECFDLLALRPDHIIIPEAGSLRELVGGLAQIVPEASLSVNEIRPRGIEVLAEHRPDSALAVGSSFKLYVLAAVVDAVGLGALSWSDPLYVDSRESPLTARSAAVAMVSQSDNPSTDALIDAAGRPAVEKAFERYGLRDPTRNRPLITTAEMLALKAVHPAPLVDRFLAGDGQERQELLPALRKAAAAAPSPSWTTPVAISKLEWFSSAADLTRCLVGLHRRSAADRTALDGILGANRGLELDRDAWTRVWFKGGGEPGVFSLAWLVERVDGQTFTVAAVLNDPAMALDPSATQSVVAGIFQRLAEA